MNTKLKNRLNMFGVTLEVYDKFSASITMLPALIAVFLLIRNKVKELRKIAEEMMFALTGLTKAKNALREELTVMALRIQGAIHSYAVTNNLELLKDETHVPESSIHRYADVFFYGFCNGLYNRAITLDPVAMSDNGADPATLAEMSVVLAKFDDILNEPAEARKQRKTKRRQMAKLDFEIRYLLRENVDKLMYSYMKSNPDFYETYTESRHVTDTGHKQSKAEQNVEAEIEAGLINVTVFDSITNLPVEGAIVKIKNTEIEEETDPDGYAYGEKIPLGTLFLTVEHPDYSLYENPNVNVESGDEIDLEVWLTPTNTTDPSTTTEE